MIIEINKVPTIDITEGATAVENMDPTLTTVTVNTIDGFHAAAIAKQDEERGETLAPAHGVILHTPDGGVFLAIMEDSSEFPKILVTLI